MPPQILMHAARACASHALPYVAALSRRQLGRDEGQTTAEYGLVILAAGTLALAAILWARSSGSVTSLFETVIDRLTGGLD